jgi:hypothetical protein
VSQSGGEPAAPRAHRYGAGSHDVDGSVFGRPPSALYEVVTAGVVIAREVRVGEVAYKLRSGTEVTVRSGESLVGFSADLGDLVLVGTVPRSWAYVATPSPLHADCYIVDNGAVWDSGATVDVFVTTERKTTSEPDHGYLQLPKAPGYSEKVRANGRVDGLIPTCLDEQGRVTDVFSA